MNGIITYIKRKQPVKISTILSKLCRLNSDDYGSDDANINDYIYLFNYIYSIDESSSEKKRKRRECNYTICELQQLFLFTSKFISHFTTNYTIDKDFLIEIFKIFFTLFKDINLIEALPQNSDISPLISSIFRQLSPYAIDFNDWYIDKYNDIILTIIYNLSIYHSSTSKYSEFFRKSIYIFNNTYDLLNYEFQNICINFMRFNNQEFKIKESIINNWFVKLELLSNNCVDIDNLQNIIMMYRDVNYTKIVKSDLINDSLENTIITNTPVNSRHNTPQNSRIKDTPKHRLNDDIPTSIEDTPKYEKKSLHFWIEILLHMNQLPLLPDNVNKDLLIFYTLNKNLKTKLFYNGENNLYDHFSMNLFNEQIDEYLLCFFFSSINHCRLELTLIRDVILLTYNTNINDWVLVILLIFINCIKYILIGDDVDRVIPSIIHIEDEIINQIINHKNHILNNLYMSYFIQLFYSKDGPLYPHLVHVFPLELTYLIKCRDSLYIDYPIEITSELSKIQCENLKKFPSLKIPYKNQIINNNIFDFDFHTIYWNDVIDIYHYIYMNFYTYNFDKNIQKLLSVIWDDDAIDNYLIKILITPLLLKLLCLRLCDPNQINQDYEKEKDILKDNYILTFYLKKNEEKLTDFSEPIVFNNFIIRNKSFQLDNITRKFIDLDLDYIKNTSKVAPTNFLRSSNIPKNITKYQVIILVNYLLSLVNNPFNNSILSPIKLSSEGVLYLCRNLHNYNIPILLILDVLCGYSPFKLYGMTGGKHPLTFAIDQLIAENSICQSIQDFHSEFLYTEDIYYYKRSILYDYVLNLPKIDYRPDDKSTHDDLYEHTTSVLSFLKIHKIPITIKSPILSGENKSSQYSQSLNDKIFYSYEQGNFDFCKYYLDKSINTDNPKLLKIKCLLCNDVHNDLKSLISVNLKKGLKLGVSIYSDEYDDLSMVMKSDEYKYTLENMKSIENQVVDVEKKSSNNLMDNKQYKYLKIYYQNLKGYIDSVKSLYLKCQSNFVSYLCKLLSSEFSRKSDFGLFLTIFSQLTNNREFSILKYIEKVCTNFNYKIISFFIYQIVALFVNSSHNKEELEYRILKILLNGGLKNSPYLTIFSLLQIALSREISSEKRDRSIDFLKSFSGELKKKAIRAKSLFEFYISLSNFKNTIKNKSNPLKLSEIHKYTDFSKMEIPIVTQVSTNNNILHSFDDEIEFLTTGISCPKKIRAIDTNGIHHVQLVKGDDDLRQDKVMTQIFIIVNEFLGKMKYNLITDCRIRYFQVVPLSDTAGVIEFLSNTLTISDYIIGTTYEDQRDGSHYRYFPKEMTAQNIRSKMYSLHQSSQTSGKKVLQNFQKFKQDYSPTLNYIFYEVSKSVNEYVSYKFNFEASLCLNNLIGYVLGIGDRHLNNILIDKNCLELVHIDFGIAFDGGRKLPMPEVVPFQMTQNFLSCLGVFGVSGPFLKFTEIFLNILYKRKKILVSIISVFASDPLHRLHTNPEKFFKKNGYSLTIASDVLEFVRRRLSGFHDMTTVTPLSCKDVCRLIYDEALDDNRLANMFSGWQAWV